MVQIKITRAKVVFEDGDEVVLAVGDDLGVQMMCLLDNGWLLTEWELDADDLTTFYPPGRILWAQGVV
jgi:hypothetical protein